MKINKFIDDSYRVLIPQEIRDILHINKKDKVDLEICDNKIILSFPEKASKVNLEPQKIIETESRLSDLTKIDNMIYKSKPTQIKHKLIKYKPDDVISFRTDKDNLDLELYCGKCGKLIKDTSKAFLKVNDEFICDKCVEALKQQLIDDGNKSK